MITSLNFSILVFIFSYFETIPVGKISTPLGDIWISLDNRTPNHRESFIELAQAGYWDSLTFNRVIPNFVAQGAVPIHLPDSLIRNTYSTPNFIPN